ncbi:MAG TPA: hypothetical protein VGM39_13815 [Kofleriaceae bacterium]|jgi:hypothetical protein
MTVPPLVEMEDTPERLVLTWRGTLLGRLLFIGVSVVLAAITPFLVIAERGIGPKVFFVAMCAVAIGAAIVAWYYRGRLELTATRMISTESWLVTRTKFDHDPGDIEKLEVDQRAVSNGKSVSLEWQLRAKFVDKQRIVVAVLPSEAVANYVREQLERRLAKLAEWRSSLYR